MCRDRHYRLAGRRDDEGRDKGELGRKSVSLCSITSEVGRASGGEIGDGCMGGGGAWPVQLAYAGGMWRAVRRMAAMCPASVSCTVWSSSCVRGRERRLAA
jgi:hypothetical protein